MSKNNMNNPKRAKCKIEIVIEIVLFDLNVRILTNRESVKCICA